MRGRALALHPLLNLWRANGVTAMVHRTSFQLVNDYQVYSEVLAPQKTYHRYSIHNIITSPAKQAGGALQTYPSRDWAGSHVDTYSMTKVIHWLCVSFRVDVVITISIASLTLA
jgi:hypothetical protein